MPDKTKDGLKAIQDLIDLNIRHDLQVRQPPQEMEEVHKWKRVKNNEATQETSTEGQQRMMVKKDYYCPYSCFTLSLDEVTQLFKCLLGVKVPFGYSGMISRYLDPNKQSFSGMKLHKCHVMMMQILPVAIRVIMDKHIRDTLTN
jgi:hypothetical protein